MILVVVAASNWQPGPHAVSTIEKSLQAVAESRPARDINNVPQMTVKVFLKANIRAGVNTSDILLHDIEKEFCTSFEAIRIIRNWEPIPQGSRRHSLQVVELSQRFW